MTEAIRRRPSTRPAPISALGPAKDVPVARGRGSPAHLYGTPRQFSNLAESVQKAPTLHTQSAAAPALLQLHRGTFAKPVALPEAKPAQAAPKSALRAAFEALPNASAIGGARLLESNHEAWLSVWSLLEDAKGGIDSSYFILQRDIFGMSFLGQLYRRARDGDPVRLMVDAAGDSFGRKGFTLSFRGQDYLQELLDTGNAEVRVYHPIHKKILDKAKELGPFAMVANNHDKLVRSSDRAITGGRNISKDYFTDPKDRADVYRDCDVLVDGEAASGVLKDTFDVEFDRAELHYKVGGDFFGNWARRDLELVGAYLMMDEWLNAAPLSEANKTALRNDPATQEAKAEELLQRAIARLPDEGIDREPGLWDLKNLRKMARELAGHAELCGANRGFDPKAGLHQGIEMKALDRTSAAVGDKNDISAALASLAKTAKDRIVIQNPYVVLTNEAIAVLKEAGERGVKIDLMTNSPDSTDSVLTQAFFLTDWPRLLATIPNLRIFALTGEQKLHAKVAVADDELTAVTSYNLDLLSERVNGEIGVASWSKDLAKDLLDAVAQDIADPAKGVVEYTILRDDQGKPVLKDGEPVVTFGAQNHLSAMRWRQYQVLCWLVEQLRKLPILESLQRPPLEV